MRQTRKYCQKQEDLHKEKNKPLMPDHQPFVEDVRVSLIVLKAFAPAQKHQVCK